MTREEAKEFYPFLQAFAEGKIIETRRKPTADNNGVTKDGWFEFNDWTEMKELEYWINVDYRIKPEPKYRPFKDAEECWQEMQKHQPFGWVKYANKYISISAIDSNNDYETDFDDYTFADGTPFGVKVEQLMYRPITMYQIVCDRCGEVFGGTDTCSALFSNKEVDIGDYSDWEMIDGKHYCPDCYEVEVIDGVYNIKAKQI